MKHFGPLARTVAFVGVAAMGALAAAPAYAGPAEAAVLESYFGTWKGKGQLAGARTETVVCRMTLSKGNAGKATFNGRCAMAGVNMSVNGTLAYIDQNKRYEAVMTTNAGYSGMAVGKRVGSGGIDFAFQDREKDDQGNNMAISAAIGLRDAKAMSVNFKVVFPDTGDSITASVPFSK